MIMAKKISLKCFIPFKLWGPPPKNGRFSLIYAYLISCLWFSISKSHVKKWNPWDHVLLLQSQSTDISVGCLWQATVRFRRIFSFFVDAKRQIWLTSNYIPRKILRFSQVVACAGDVVLEATCTSSGNKQKVRHFRKDCASTLCVELNCENRKEFADHPFRVTHRTNGFTVYSACQTQQRVLQPNLRVHPIDLRPWH